MVQLRACVRNWCCVTGCTGVEAGEDLFLDDFPDAFPGGGFDGAVVALMVGCTGVLEEAVVGLSFGRLKGTKKGPFQAARRPRRMAMA